MEPTSLELQGRRIRHQTGVLEACSLVDKLSGEELESVRYEIERFDMWAESVGLFYGDKASLDYRLRGSKPLTDFILSLLGDLHGALKLRKSGQSLDMILVIDHPVVQFCTGGLESMPERPDNESELSDVSSDGDDTVPIVILSEVTEVVDQLYNFDWHIRKAESLNVVDEAIEEDLSQHDSKKERVSPRSKTVNPATRSTCQLC